jgi:hypothetical protein
MEATRPFETSVLRRPTRRHFSEDGILHCWNVFDVSVNCGHQHDLLRITKYSCRRRDVSTVSDTGERAEGNAWFTVLSLFGGARENAELCVIYLTGELASPWIIRPYWCFPSPPAVQFYLFQILRTNKWNATRTQRACSCSDVTQKTSYRFARIW